MYYSFSLHLTLDHYFKYYVHIAHSSKRNKMLHCLNCNIVSKVKKNTWYLKHSLPHSDILHKSSVPACSVLRTSRCHFRLVFVMYVRTLLEPRPAQRLTWLRYLVPLLTSLRQMADSTSIQATTASFHTFYTWQFTFSTPYSLWWWRSLSENQKINISLKNTKILC